MSLDISVTHKITGESLDVNWTRNPYGLCQWAEDNYALATERSVPEKQSLYYVCNNWAYGYDAEGPIDRKLFLDVVMNYGAVLLNLDQGFFFFDEHAFNQFINPNWHHLARYADQKELIMKWKSNHKIQWVINQELFGHPAFHLNLYPGDDHHTLARYQKWYRELIEIAEFLQDPETEFYCSN